MVIIGNLVKKMQSESLISNKDTQIYETVMEINHYQSRWNESTWSFYKIYESLFHGSVNVTKRSCYERTYSTKYTTTNQIHCSQMCQF